MSASDGGDMGLFGKEKCSESLVMKKPELLLANFDARIPNISIKPKNTN